MQLKRMLKTEQREKKLRGTTRKKKRKMRKSLESESKQQ